MGLTPAEAFAKQRDIEMTANPIRPLQDIYTEEMIAQYKGKFTVCQAFSGFIEPWTNL